MIMSSFKQEVVINDKRDNKERTPYSCSLLCNVYSVGDNDTTP